MKTYQRNGEWFALAEGGQKNRDDVPAEEIGPFDVKPEPVTRWRVVDETDYGEGISCFTRFCAGDKCVVVEDFRWNPAWGYSWEEWHETFRDDLPEPPEFGEAYRWDGSGWKPAKHPNVV